MNEKKQKMIKNPSGILQITPESLEALLLHKHGMITKLFSDLQFIVIDEVHSLLRNDRGGQTLCLIDTQSIEELINEDLFLMMLLWSMTVRAVL